MSKFKELIDQEMSYISEVAPAGTPTGPITGQPQQPVQQGTSKPPAGPANAPPTMQQFGDDIYKTAGPGFPELLKYLNELSNKNTLATQPAAQSATQTTGQEVQPPAPLKA